MKVEHETRHVGRLAVSICLRWPEGWKDVRALRDDFSVRLGPKDVAVIASVDSCGHTFRTQASVAAELLTASREDGLRVLARGCINELDLAISKGWPAR